MKNCFSLRFNTRYGLFLGKRLEIRDCFCNITSICSIERPGIFFFRFSTVGCVIDVICVCKFLLQGSEVSVRIDAFQTILIVIYDIIEL